MIGIIGTIYKPSHAFVTVCLYPLLGFLGFPVFAGGAGGASHFLGPTAGFLLFFPFRAWITSLFTNAKSSIFTIFLPISSVVLSSLCQELSALCWSRIPISKSICFGRRSFILADLIKLVIITITSKAIFASLKHHWYFK